MEKTKETFNMVLDTVSCLLEYPLRSWDFKGSCAYNMFVSVIHIFNFQDPAQLERGKPESKEELGKWIKTPSFTGLDKRGQEAFFR